VVKRLRGVQQRKKRDSAHSPRESLHHWHVDSSTSRLSCPANECLSFFDALPCALQQTCALESLERLEPQRNLTN